MLKEASTITDIHNSSDSAEVNLVSLVSEQIPKYRLRADSATGYCQQDWLQTPLLCPDSDAELSPELYEQTFQYFLLSGDRLSQMTQTYHDIEAVTRLLEEKERDLELAARIGQTLLQKNREAEQCNEELGIQLENVLEEVSQLKHEISLKEDLLHTYVNEETDSSAAPSPVKEFRRFGAGGLAGDLEGLQTSIKRLEVDNDELREHKVKYECESEELESHEQMLVSDALKELEDMRRELKNARDSNHMLSDELSQKNDEGIRLQEEVTRLLSKIVDMQRKQKQVALENEELQQHLMAANSSQMELTKEIQILEDQYEDISLALDEAREETRFLRDQQPEDYMQTIPFSDSLAAELQFENIASGQSSSDMHFESFITKNEIAGSPIAKDAEDNFDAANLFERTAVSKSSSQRAFDAVNFVNRMQRPWNRRTVQPLTPAKQERPIPTPFPLSSVRQNSSPISSDGGAHGASGCMSSTPCLQAGRHPFFKNLSNVKKHAFDTPRLAKSTANPHAAYAMNPVNSLRGLNVFSSVGRSGLECVPDDETNRSSSVVSAASVRRHVCSSTPSLGRPGIPGTEDLERAIKKLALRRESVRYIEVERRRCQRRDAGLTGSNSVTAGISGSNLSMASSSSDISGANPTRLPKLRIIKPLEGSITLNHWKYLAGRDRTLQLPRDASPGVLTRDRVAEAQAKSAESCSKSANSSSGADIPKSVKRTPVLRLNRSDGLDKVLENTAKVNEVVKHREAVASIGIFTTCSESPGKSFAFTSTRYTFTNCRVKYPDDEYEITPSLSTTDPITSTLVETSCVQSVHAFRRQTCFEKSTCNTKTCSTELSIAKYLKEHGTKSKGQSIKNSVVDHCNHKENGRVRNSSPNEGRLSGKSTGEYEKLPAGSVVWNRTLKRAFLLSVNHPMAENNLMPKLDGSVISAKPETPPNSPSREFEYKFPDLGEDCLQPDSETAISCPAREEAVASPNPRDISPSSNPSVENTELPASQQSSCEDLRNMDWSELHGSSGTLCAPGNDEQTATNE